MITRTSYLLHATLLALSLVCGCIEEASASDVQQSLEYEKGRGQAAAVIPFLQQADAPTPPAPAPEPTPTPGGPCARCDGTGEIRPDGVIPLKCPDCGGDGVLSQAELADALRRYQIAKAIDDRTRAEAAKVPADKPAELKPAALTVPELTNGDYEPAEPVDVVWYTSLEEGYRQSKATGKQALIYWWGNSCAQPGRACWHWQKNIGDNPRVSAILATRFVCVKINAEKWALSDDTRDQDRLRTWGIAKVPSVTIVSPDWTKSKKLPQNNTDAELFVDTLNRRWWVEGTEATPTGRLTKSSTGCGHPDCRCGPNCQCRWPGECVGEPDPRAKRVGARQTLLLKPSDIPIEQGLDVPDETLAVNERPAKARAVSTAEPRTVYVIQSGGSSGGYGGNGSAGGYGGYSSGGSSGGYGGYYAQPAYDYPTSYGSYYGGGGGGSTMVCGPNGCYFQ